MSKNDKSQIFTTALKQLFKGLFKLILISLSAVMKFIAIASEKVSEWTEQIAKSKT